MNIGVMWRFVPDKIDGDLAMLSRLGFHSCHLAIPDPSLYDRLKPGEVSRLFEDQGMAIGAIWCGLGQPSRWDLVDGPKTVGFVPREYRRERLDIIARCGEFSAAMGVADIITHVGFIPEDETTALYDETSQVLGKVADSLAKYSCALLMETGQETPVSLLRTLEDLNRGNVGVNLDTGNLVMYGKGDPSGAIDTLGKNILGVHAKDGRYPAGGREIGQETCCGDGVVRFAEVVSKLKKLGYAGDIMIEREIEGPQRVVDIVKARDLLRPIIDTEK